MDLLFEPFEALESELTRSGTCGTSQLPFTSELHTATSCKWISCVESHEYQPQDGQAIDTPNPLLREQYELRMKINHRYDRLTSRLPLELISDIFLRIVNEAHGKRRHMEGELNPVVMLGTVCQRWREITLGTPKLWTKFLITARNLKHAAFPRIISERLSRSRTLPLSLVVIGHDIQIPFPVSAYLDIVPILRSEVRRWKDLEIHGTMSILRPLLTGIEDKVDVDSLLIHMSDADPDALDKITMRHPFTPKRLNVNNVSLPKIPIQWSALTHLSANYISADELLHVFRRAQNLQYCCLNAIADEAQFHPSPASSITNVSIRQLEAHRQGIHTEIGVILCHLTLPSLESLDYTIGSNDPYYTEEMEVLCGFLDRSQAPLHHFLFSYVDMDCERNTDWYPTLPHITCLELRVREYLDNGRRMQAHLERLGPHATPTVLPRLRELKLHAQTMSPRSWTALAEMFSDHENEKDRARPLNSVKIYLERPSDFGQEAMPEGTFSRLCSIRQSGIRIQVFGESQHNIEILEPWDPMGPDELFSMYCLLSDDE